MSQRPLARRSLLRLSTALSIPILLGRTGRLFAEERPAIVGGPAGPRRTLVIVQLSGGNDGLSTIVPYADDAYHKARRTTRIAKPLPLDDHVGLHPDLDKLRPLYDDGKLAIIQGTGYPKPNRSHFKSLEIWHTADLRGRHRATGWLGRAMDLHLGPTAQTNAVINLGKTAPYAITAKHQRPVSFERLDRYRWDGSEERQPAFEGLNERGGEGKQAEWLHDVASAARASSARLRALALRHEPTSPYPKTRGSASLRTVAGLICGGLGTQVYYVTASGFDTHNGQKGRHDRLMRGLGDTLAAFQADLAGHGKADNVLTMVFSEFGRRVKENASGGTDHGVAGPMFLLGGAVRGGLHGRHPSLTDLDKGDLKMTTDFRSVYATVLDRWMGIPASKVLGAEFPALDVL